MFFQPNQSHVDTHAYDRFDRMALKMYAVYMRSLALFICHLPCLKKSWQCAKKSNFHDKWKERQIKKHICQPFHEHISLPQWWEYKNVFSAYELHEHPLGDISGWCLYEMFCFIHCLSTCPASLCKAFRNLLGQ